LIPRTRICPRTAASTASSATRSALEKTKRANGSGYGAEMMSATWTAAVLNVQDLN